MNRLVRIVRNSRGWSELGPYLAQRKQQPTTSKGWWFWPFSMVLFVWGAAILVLALYAGEAVHVIFAVVWLTGLTYMAWPSRRVWLLHRAEQHNR